MALSPTSELEAVNFMLRSIGDTGINTLENIEVTDAGDALSYLRVVSRAVQARGWHWNTDDDFPIQPDENEYLTLPSNTLKVDTTGSDAGKDLVQRGTRLYDRRNHTYKFADPVTVDLVQMLPFEELPEVARQYVFIKAARMFQDGAVGSQVLHKYQKDDEDAALARLEADDTENADYNYLTDSPSTFNIINRRFVPWR